MRIPGFPGRPGEQVLPAGGIPVDPVEKGGRYMNGNLQKMMKQAQKLQRQMLEAQEALAQERVEATSGGGVVRVVADGQQNVLEIKIDPQAVDPEDVEMLEDLVLAAVTEALRKSRELAEERLGAFTKGLKIPGLF